jgi:hypothetical protein
MISMILLMQHLVEPTNEDGARPKGNWRAFYHTDRIQHQTGIPTYRAADQEGRTHAPIHLAIEEQTG